MKKNTLLIIAVIATCFSYSVNAQVSLQVNIGSQPIWGPTGYDHVDYYYIPDVDAYYDVNAQQYTYQDGGQWVTTGSLPPRYSNFDLYNAHKVVINERTPWIHNDRYRTKYARYKGKHDQHPIRDSHDQKYLANPNHPEHSKWQSNNSHQPAHGNAGHGNNSHQPKGNNAHHDDHGHDDHDGHH